MLNVLISQDSPHKERKRSLYPNNYGISFLQHLITLKAGIKEHEDQKALETNVLYFHCELKWYIMFKLYNYK